MTNRIFFFILLVVIIFTLRWAQIYNRVKTSKDLTDQERQALTRQLIAEILAVLAFLLQVVDLNFSLLGYIRYFTFYIAVIFMVLSSIRNRISIISGKEGPLIVKGKTAVANAIGRLILILLIQVFLYFFWWA